MINVPERVKDALRSGEYKKEYLIYVGHYRTYFSDVGTVAGSFYEEWGSFLTSTLNRDSSTYGYYKSGNVTVSSNTLCRIYPQNEPSNYATAYWMNGGSTRWDIISGYGKLYLFTTNTYVFGVPYGNVDLENTTLNIDKRTYAGARATSFTVDTSGVYKFYINEANSFSRLRAVSGGTTVTGSATSASGVTYAIVSLNAGNTYTLYFDGCDDTKTFTYAIEIKDEYVQDKILDNSYLVAESVKFDERMCSDSELKFGLCEGTSVEFQYFNYDNIRDKHLTITLKVQYKNASGNLAWYEIPMGQYDVDECSRQASTGIIKVIAYNKLKSTYLDHDAKIEIENIVSSLGGEATVYDILSQLLDGYSIPYSDFIEEQGKIISSSYEPYIGPIPLNRYLPDGTSVGYFKVWLLQLSYGPIDATSIYTDDYYKYLINMPAIWNAFKDVLSTSHDDAGNAHIITDYISRPDLEMHAEYNTFRYFAEHSIRPYMNNQGGQFYEGWAVADVNPSIAYHRTANYETGIKTEEVLRLYIPFYISDGSEDETLPAFTAAYNSMMDKLRAINLAVVYKLDISAIENKKINMSYLLGDQGSITLRDLQSAVFEINCQYGKIDRITNLFSGIELNNSALYPRDTLYPDNELLPMGMSESGYPSMYSKLWADEGNVRSFRYLIITYKTTETIEGQTQEVEKTLQRTVNANGTDNYNMSDNWLFRNLIWTAVQVGAYADAMVAKMQNIRWFPFEMWSAGLPYIEAGDEIEIQMNEGTYKSYVLRRTLSGIQNLQDEMINGTLDIF